MLMYRHVPFACCPRSQSLWLLDASGEDLWAALVGPRCLCLKTLGSGVKLRSCHAITSLSLMMSGSVGIKVNIKNGKLF